MAMTVMDLLNFLAPELAGVSLEDKQTAIEMAEPYRPWCLPIAQQDEAQALYAAWLLSCRQTDSAAGGGSDGGAVTGPIKLRKEGDLTVEYATASDLPGTSALSSGDYRARYDALAGLCRVGAVVVGRPTQRRARRG